MTIGVLGNIGAHKGGAVIQHLSQKLPLVDPAARLVVIGNVDPAFRLHPDAHIHGNYDRARISELAHRYGVSCWLIPSTWPETFSYTTHEALATGLPVLTFDLGAQGEAVQNAASCGAVVATLPMEVICDPGRIIRAAQSLCEQHAQEASAAQDSFRLAS